MNDTPERAQRESIILRVLWMLVFLVVWQLAELLLGGLVLVQLIYRLVYGAPSASGYINRIRYGHRLCLQIYKVKKPPPVQEWWFCSQRFL